MRMVNLAMYPGSLQAGLEEKERGNVHKDAKAMKCTHTQRVWVQGYGQLA